MKKFKEKQVLITGTARGIGRALCEYFAEEDAIVYAVARKNVNYLHDNIIPIIGDINDYKHIVKQIDNMNGDIDILINNAGVIYYKDLIDAVEEEIQDVFSTNVISTLMLSNEIVKRIITMKKKGVIINTLSFAANIPSSGSGIYAASKAALYSLTKTMAAEYAPYKIRVNGYSPGVIETEMTKPAIMRNKTDMVDAIALHRIGTTNDVVHVVGFLASDDAAYITGANLDVSGGKFIVQNAKKGWEL